MTQPKIEGVGHGVPRMPYGSDGEHWYALKVRDSGILEVCSKSGDKIFGFESIVEEALVNLNLPAGASGLNGTPVPAGKIWKITHGYIVYIGTVPSEIYLQVVGLAIELTLQHSKSPISSQSYFWSGEVYAQAGDYVRGYVVGATAGDDLYVRYAGVQMNAP